MKKYFNMNNRKKNPLFGHYNSPMIFRRKSPAEVIFGAPGQGCNGYGVCLITSRPVSGRYPCPATPCMVAFSQSMEVIQIEMVLADITPEVYGRFLGNRSHFLVEEEYLLPLSIMKGLGRGQRYAIPAGNYPLSLSEDKITIRMPVQEIWTGRHARGGILSSIERALTADIFRSFFRTAHRLFRQQHDGIRLDFLSFKIEKREIILSKI